MPETKGKYRDKKEYHLVYCALINAARNKRTITYMEVAGLMGIHKSGSHMASQTGHMLGEISEDEHEQGRPLLSAIAVSSVDGKPGKGFYGWAKQLGRLKDDSEAVKKKFWEEEKLAVYDTWS